MASLARKAARFAAAAILIAAALAATTTWWTRHDPLYFLPRSASAPAVQLDRIEHRAGRVFEHVTLSDRRLRSIRVTLHPSRPPARPKLTLLAGPCGTG